MAARASISKIHTNETPTSIVEGNIDQLPSRSGANNELTNLVRIKATALNKLNREATADEMAAAAVTNRQRSTRKLKDVCKIQKTYRFHANYRLHCIRLRRMQKKHLKQYPVSGGGNQRHQRRHHHHRKHHRHHHHHHHHHRKPSAGLFLTASNSSMIDGLVQQQNNNNMMILGESTMSGTMKDSNAAPITLVTSSSISSSFSSATSTTITSTTSDGFTSSSDFETTATSSDTSSSLAECYSMANLNIDTSDEGHIGSKFTGLLRPVKSSGANKQQKAKIPAGEHNMILFIYDFKKRKEKRMNLKTFYDFERKFH